MERPNSMALRGEFSFFAKRKFSGLRLRWIMPCRWQICTTDLGAPTQAREATVIMRGIYLRRTWNFCQPTKNKKIRVRIPKLEPLIRRIRDH
jgi:hypothetical protein